MAQPETVAVRPFPQLERHRLLRLNLARSLYARSTNNELAFRWINRDFVRGLRQLSAPPLDAAGLRVARDLRRTGIAFADFSEFFERSFFEGITAAFNGFREEFIRTNPNPTLKGKAIFLDTIHKAHTFRPSDPVSTYLAAPAFAAIAAEYMRMVPRYVGCSFWHTKKAPGDRTDSQVWHRDYNDRRLVKSFLYLNDVGAENGYFEYVAGTHIHGPYGRRFDRIGSNGYRAYPDQDALASIIRDLPVISLDSIPGDRRSGEAAPWSDRPSVVRCLAPAGTLIFADTFGLHRGGYVKEGHRDMIMSTYSTNFNVHKPHFAVTREFVAELTPFMRMAFGVG